MFRLRHTSVTGFPRCGSIAACRASRPAPPSSNRTCGFPASGSPENSRLRHTRRITPCGPSWQRLPQILQAPVNGPSSSRGLTISPLSLSASFRLRSESLIRCGAFAQAVLLSYWRKRVSGQAPSLHGHYPASALLWACPTPERGAREVMSSSAALRLGPRPNGPPRFLGRSFLARRPLSPRRARHLPAPVPHLPALGFAIPGRLAARDSLTRPNRVRFRYGSRVRLTRLRQTGSPRPALDRLLVKRAIYKVNSFQSTRSTRLGLAHQDNRILQD
jgi:hypothetical protein